MKKTFFKIVSTFYLVLCPTLVWAGWYEVTGRATVVASEEVARIHALEDAIFKAVSFSGADIGSIANIRPILESKRKEYQLSNTEIRYILIDEQKVRNGVMFVKARMDIYPSATACHLSQYKKPS